MSSWIKLFRDINKHWIWQNSDYLKWWLDILLEVNHAPAKVVINNKIYDCNRGEKLYSLDTWAHRWGTNKSKVRRFLQLLQNDNMIVLKSETQTTRLTVCKYDTYQDTRNADETQMKRKRNASETHLTPIEEGKEEKEGKELFLLEKETKEENLSKENKTEIFPQSESVEPGAEERKKVAQKKEKAIPPDLDTFLIIAKEIYENELKVDFSPFKFSVEAKYNTWIENDWKDGNGNEIKNWKSKLRNTIPHLKAIYGKSNSYNGKTGNNTYSKQASFNIREASERLANDFEKGNILGVY